MCVAWEITDVINAYSSLTYLFLIYVAMYNNYRLDYGRLSGMFGRVPPGYYDILAARNRCFH